MRCIAPKVANPAWQREFMSGVTARLGFRFQDGFLLREGLRQLHQVLAVSWQQGSLDPCSDIRRCPIQFAIEAGATVSDAAPEWDSLFIEDGRTKVLEIKSGQVSADDRRAIWRRIRKETAASVEKIAQVDPVLVIDPSRTGNCDAFCKLAEFASQISGPPPLPVAPPSSVSDAATLFEEALWWLCVASKEDSLVPPLPPMDALDILRRFCLIPVNAQQLEREVRAYLEGLFPSLLVETTERLLRGWLDERATASDPRNRRFSLEAILNVTGCLEQCVALRPGQLARWRTLWMELREQQSRRSSGRLGLKGSAIPPTTTQPIILNRVVSGSLGGLVVLGEGGAGKSTLLNQMALSLPQHRTLLGWAAGGSEADVETLADSIRFQSVLCSLAGNVENVTVLIDSLEEADPPLRQCWARHLSRLAGLPSVRVVPTMREADFRSDGFVRSQFQGWEELTLQHWSEAVVRDLLVSAGSPQPSASLVLLLRRPIFLDLYWRTFVEGSPVTPLPPGDSTTRHGLLRAFWLNRLLQSPRHQHLGEVARRCETVFAVAATELNDFPETGLDSKAVAALLSEGVLAREVDLQVRLRFRHPFLRDFAFSQWCLADRDAARAYDRWKSIRSSITRAGALRAMVEALGDSSSDREFSELPLTRLAAAYFAGESDSRTEFIRSLAAIVPDKRTNPVQWPAGLQSQLGPSFGTQLLAEARYHGNTAWAEPIEAWPCVASWLPDDFPAEAWRYACFVAARSKQQPDSAELRLQTCVAARALRTMSEQCRFRAVFGNPGRWLKNVAICLVVPLLPDVESLAWLEQIGRAHV